MSDLVTEFGKFICRETPRRPALARRALLTAYRAKGLQLKAAPDRGLPPSRQYAALLCNRAVIRTLSRPEESALVSVFLPCELLDAFGVHPMCAELYSCFINGVAAEPVFAETAESAGLAETYCSYHKILMGSALSGVLPRPSFIVNTSLICDANNLTFRALAQYYGIPQFYVDVPPRQDEESIRYVADQLQDLAAFLEQQTGKRLDEAALRSALERSRRTIGNFRACIPEKRAHYLPSDLTSEMYEIYTTHIALGTEEAETYSRLLLRDLRAAGPARGLRLLWIHTIPNWQPPLRELFNESERYQVIACDLNFEGLVEIDPDRPYESMARRLVESSFNGSAERRIQKALEMARALDVDGTVCFCHWGCKQTMGASAAIKRELEAAGFPTLILNGDGCDRSNSSDGQVSTRMGAFLEMLEASPK